MRRSVIVPDASGRARRDSAAMRCLLPCAARRARPADAVARTGGRPSGARRADRRERRRTARTPASVGRFHDPLPGPRFGYGRSRWAGSAAARAGLGRMEPARRASLARGGAGRRAGRLPALVRGAGLRARRTVSRPGTRAELAGHLAVHRAPVVGPKARRCFESPDCFHNLELVNAVATLELARPAQRRHGLRTRTPSTSSRSTFRASSTRSSRRTAARCSPTAPLAARLPHADHRAARAGDPDARSRRPRAAAPSAVGDARSPIRAAT